MKKLFPILPLIVLFAVACNSAPQKAAAKKDTVTAKAATDSIQYTCSMHPEVVTTKPGTCPKCGMDLVEKE